MKKHFKVERHNATAWRIVNAHFGHGLIFPTRETARASCKHMNFEFARWERLGKDVNTLPVRSP